ncbi:hypothetical protein TNCV_191351 [Trichonephila clavipes]|nr:hypothetical protein TNCV_191351 [Trichonephila clavipes]
MERSEFRDALSVPNTQSNCQPDLILNILTAASASLARFQESEESSRRRYQGNRWQDLKKRIQRHTRKIRNSSMYYTTYSP